MPTPTATIMQVQTLTRRQALIALGGATSAVAFGLRAPGVSRALSCPATPAETEGPYFVDELLERSDIRSDPTDGTVRPGVPLRLGIVVTRADADCAPAAGVQVDVWHADAGGTYSDEAAIGTAGRKFLRGYQVTDANGAVEFTTVYPGWYPGRTIHVHFKVRTFDGTEEVYDFTSQLYFDEAANDAVMAQSPYAARGERDTRNADDGIFDDTTALVVPLTADGSGGWAGTFTAALTGLPATTAPSSCGDASACGAAVTAALPDPATAADAASRRTARRLDRLGARLTAILERAASASGARRSRQLRRAGAVLTKLRSVARAADARGTLGASLATLERAIAGLASALAEGRGTRT